MNVKALKNSPPFQGGDLGVVETKIGSSLKPVFIKATSPNPSLLRRGESNSRFLCRAQVNIHFVGQFKDRQHSDYSILNQGLW
ncbi:hypothetical protein CWD77_12060 [Rhodohalobacter barkolensis]|uniref:Uncharacterized protein n=1 Tax=Rhodohalobacter barkolensis TaxID=2053187 RepID=A0A2N0VGM8_9BACT|nr:hypothetical protein CWD77_12060 [Rhodohalobacter barkolensis]